MFDSVNASLTIIKANTKQYKQHKSRPLLIITRDIDYTEKNRVGIAGKIEGQISLPGCTYVHSHSRMQSRDV
jgi:hypothetical protein